MVENLKAEKILEAIKELKADKSTHLQGDVLWVVVRSTQTENRRK